MADHSPRTPHDSPDIDAFIAWDMRIPGLDFMLEDFECTHPSRVVVMGLDLGQGEIKRLVRERIRRARRLVVFLDRANINVGFEIGHALGLGREVVLVACSRSEGGWLARSPLGGCLVTSVRSQSDLEQVAFGPNAIRLEGPSGSSAGTAFLCPGLGAAESMRRGSARRDANLGFPPDSGFSLLDLPAEIGRFARVVWAIPEEPPVEGDSDAVPAAAAAISAGYAAALGRPLHILQHARMRALGDLVVDIRPFDTVRAFQQGLDEALDAAAQAAAHAQRSALDAWRDDQRRAHRRLLPPFLRDLAELPEDHVHVELDLDCVAPERTLHSRKGAHVSGGARSGGHLDGESPAPDEAALHGARPCTLRALLDSRPGGRWVIRGEPGAGKSTSARHVVYALCDPNEAATAPVPIFVSVNALLDAGGDPLAWAEAELRREGAVATGLAEGLRELWRPDSRRPVWFLLDGLDEVVGAVRGGQAVDLIQTLAVKYPQAVLAVFTRPTGERTLDGFAAAVIRSLTPEKQGELLGQWLGPIRAGDATAALQARPRLVEVTRNPLLLTLVAWLVRRDEELPPSRVKLYEHAIGVLLGSLQKADAEARQPTSLFAEPEGALLAELALALQRTGEENWSQEQVLQIVARVLPAGSDGRAWLDRVCRRSGILAPHDGRFERWRFLHKSLREFLVAAALSRRAKPLAEVPLPKKGAKDDAWEAFDGQWGETVALLCGLLPTPRPVIDALAKRSPQVALRALRNADGMDPVVAMELGVRLPADAWDADDLWTLAREQGAGSPARQAGVREGLWGQVRPSADLQTLAALHWVLTALDGRAPEREEFFRQAGRWPEAGPPDVRALLVPIPGGVAVLGSPEGIGDNDEHPQHRLPMAAFSMGKTPVTVSLFRQLCQPGEHESRWPEADAPATSVDWWTARLFASWVDCGLPTEAQWEYACRAGTHTAYWAGDGEADLARVGWYRENSNRRVHPVGQFPANGWGLHDMHGNVWEWTADAWPSQYPRSDAAVVAPLPGAWRAVRGGAFWVVAGGCRSACRGVNDPGGAGGDLGFRLVRPAPSAPRP